MRISRTLTWACLAVCTVMVLGAVPQTPSQTNPKPSQISFFKPSEDDLLLMSLVLERVDLTDELEAYRNGSGVLFPLGEFCRLLEIGVRTTPADGTAEGFVGRIDRTFSLDLRQHRIKVSGKDVPYDPDFIRAQRSDIYVDYRALNAWFALGIEVNENGMAIVVNPKEPLPLQRRLERENLASQIKSGGNRDPGFAHVPNPYQAFGSLAIDQSLSFNQANALGAKTTSVRYAAQFASDFAQGGLNGNFDLESRMGPTGLLSYGLKNPDGGLFGFLNARQATIGDTTSLDLPMVSSAHLTSGMAVSNAPLSQGGASGVTTLTGPLPSGWDVELYRGNALIGYEEATAKGTYTFQNVPLRLGTNLFRLVFNGPLGERREETQTKNVVGTLAPGALQYNMYLGGNPGSPEWAAQTDFGLKRDLTAFSSFASEPMYGGNHDYSTVGMRGYFANALISAVLVDDPASGHASQIGGQWNWGRASVNLSQTTVNGLESSIYGRQLNPDKSDTELHVSNLSFPNWSHFLPADIEVTRQETVLGTQEWQTTGRLSYQKNGLGITNVSSWLSQSGAQGQRTGELMVTSFQNGQSLEGSLNYQWLTSPSIVSLALRTSRILRDRRMLTLGLYETPQDGDIGITGTLVRNDGDFAYGLTLSMSRTQGISLGLNISFGLERNPANGKWVTSARSQATQGSVLVHVFLDSKGTGRFESGDAPMAGVQIFVNDVSCENLTGEDGTVLISGIAPYQPADIRILESSMENPLMISELPGLRINARPGNIQTIEMPVIATAEIAGTVYTLEDKSPSPASGVMVEVVTKEGTVLLTQRSAYDGYFSIDRVPVGKYTIRAKAMGASASKSVVVPPEGAYLDGIDLTLVQGAKGKVTAKSSSL